MPSVQDTNRPLDGFAYNRREIYLDQESQQFQGNINPPIAPQPKEEIVQTNQVFPPNSIPSQSLGTFDVGNAGITNNGNAGSSIRLWAGATFENRFSAPFRVDQDGNLVASSATISGSITATSGTIGGFTIGADYIRDTANSMGLASTVTGSNDVRFWAGATFANRATTAPFAVYENGYVTLGSPASTYIQLDGPNVKIQSSDYSTGVKGFLISPDLIEAENLKARGQMKGVTFQYDVVSAVGGQLMVANSDTLSTDMTALDASTLTITGSSTFAANDILVIRATTASGIQEEWLRVTSAASAPTYSVTRDLAASYASNSNPIWLKGTTVTKQGKSDGAATYSGGWLRLFGEGTNSPYYSVFSRTGVTYNSYSERVRIGNLNGIGGFVADTFGIFMGDPTLVGNYFSYDDSSGNVILNGRRFIADPVFGDGSDGDVTISSNTTLTRDMFYDHLVVSTTFTLNPGGYRIFAKTSVIINGTGSIARNGNNGGNGGTGAAGIGGAAGAAATALAAGSIYGGEAGTVGIAGSNGVGTPSNGVNGSAAVNGAALTGSIGTAGVVGIAGVAGGAGNSGLRAGGTGAAAGTAGALTAAKASVRNLANAVLCIDTGASPIALYTGGSQPGGAGGSGSGGSGTAGISGSAGGSGGCGGTGGIVFIASPTITIGASASIKALGGNGGNGGNGEAGGGANSGGGGGGSSGSGGSGGEIILIYTTLNNSGSISVVGGSPGTPGTKGNGNGTGAAGADGNTGNTGSTGKIYQLQLL